MCRLLVVKAATGFAIAPFLERFALTARASREFQGDGWGCAWWTGTRWERYRSITPVWDDTFDRFDRTTVLIAHARSAFRNEGIVVENNMPFVEHDLVFAFNGELQGVRLTAEGRIGAEKLFRFLVLRGADLSPVALSQALDLVARRTRYVRAMNLVLARGTALQVASRFSEDPDYFTMHQSRSGDRTVVASDPFPMDAPWEPIPNGTVMELQ